jgi:hypothetical protein
VRQLGTVVVSYDHAPSAEQRTTIEKCVASGRRDAIVSCLQTAGLTVDSEGPGPLLSGARAIIVPLSR